MIDDPFPRDWCELQNGVCRLFNEVGLNASTEVTLTTPRGMVTVDVYAIDEQSIDRITYIAECKNWEVAIPQATVHSFTTVMHETGSNIGFIISKHGMQSGAQRYLQNTNIIGLTYAQLQHRYFSIWWKKIFCIRLMDAIDDLVQYVEPINSRRDRFANQLSEIAITKLNELQDKYAVFGIATYMMVSPLISIFSHTNTLKVPESINDYKARLVQGFGEDFRFNAIYFRDLLEEMVIRVKSITDEFNQVFGTNIFR